MKKKLIDYRIIRYIETRTDDFVKVVAVYQLPDGRIRRRRETWKLS